MAYKYRETIKRYYAKNKDWIKEWRRDYVKRPRTRMLIKVSDRKFYEKNRDKLLAYQKEYNKKNKEKVAIRKNKYYINNKDKIRKSMNLYIMKRIKIDMSFRMRCGLRSRIYYALKGNSKSARTAELLGCPVDYFLNYIESQFDDTMSWANHGAWHLDHIIPCASFDLSKPEEQRKCFHYTNLQPLWAEDNWSKGDRWC